MVGCCRVPALECYSTSICYGYGSYKASLFVVSESQLGANRLESFGVGVTRLGSVGRLGRNMRLFWRNAFVVALYYTN